MFGSRRRWLGFLTAAGLLAGCAGLMRSAPPLVASSKVPTPTYSKAYSKVLTLGSGTEWRFEPLVVDLNRDGHLDLVATARLVAPALHMWRGAGQKAVTPIEATWSDICYAALATGGINGDRVPDIVAARSFAPGAAPPC